MNSRPSLTLRDTYQLLRNLPLMEKNDQELEALVEVIMRLRSNEEALQALQGDSSD